MSMKDVIEEKLRANINVHNIDIIDESHHHIGHAGSSDQGETHFNVKITSPDFNGLSKIKCHQMVYKALKKEMSEKIHALAIETTGTQ
ncbi:BolA family transcriptional regulator [Rickettsiales bacterium]|nr:BolA family transcriptional regulator [Rickettsiales bacterium]